MMPNFADFERKNATQQAAAGKPENKKNRDGRKWQQKIIRTIQEPENKKTTKEKQRRKTFGRRKKKQALQIFY